MGGKNIARLTLTSAKVVIEVEAELGKSGQAFSEVRSQFDLRYDPIGHLPWWQGALRVYGHLRL